MPLLTPLLVGVGDLSVGGEAQTAETDVELNGGRGLGRPLESTPLARAAVFSHPPPTARSGEDQYFFPSLGFQTPAQAGAFRSP